MKQLRFLLFTILLSVPSFVAAQNTDATADLSGNRDQRVQRTGTPAEQAARGEIPFSFAEQNLQPSLSKIRRLPPTSLPPLSQFFEKLQKPEQNGVIRRFDAPLNPPDDSAVFDVEGGRIYLLGITSEEAKAVRVRFEQVDLPEGARIFVFPANNRDEFYGAFDSKTPLTDGAFWTPPVQGDAIVVELFVPSGKETADQNYFQIKEISHNFTGHRECLSMGIPGACHNEVGSGYSSMALSVGYLEFVTSQGSFICTGTMMNTAAVTFIPYLMTANHCFSTASSAQSLRVYWNYNTGETPPGGTPFTDGASLLSTSPQSDFTFVKMTGSVPGGLTYTGWDGGDPPANSLIVGIHHPLGSHKRISFGFTKAIGSVCANGMPSACGNFIPVTWTSGVTDQGSSGSGLFYTASNGGRFIGNLWGGSSSCANQSGTDWYGRFALTYGKVSSYLADGNCTYGISSSGNTFSAAGGTGSFNVTTGTTCYYSAVVTEPTTIQTFSNANSISVADRASNTSAPGLGSLYPSNINVSGVSGTVTRIRVVLNNLTHTYPDDLDFLLVAPNGQRALLMSDAGGGTDVSNVTLTINQSATAQMQDENANATGSYRPSNFAGLNSVDLGGNDNFPSPAPGQTTYDNLLTAFYGGTPNGTWSLYVVDDETGDSGTISGGWTLDIATNSASWLTITSGDSSYGSNTVGYSVASNPSSSARTGRITVGGQVHTVTQNAGTTVINKKPFDFDGDSKTDIGIFRPSNGQWWHLRSSDSASRAAQFGTSTDIRVPADYTGDGIADIAVWRPSTGQWFIVRSENGSFYAFPFGANGDIPAPGDFDRDGKADAAVYRPSNGGWYILLANGSVISQQFGIAEDKPVVADYDGDGKDDIAVFRPSSAQWWISKSTGGVLSAQFGQTGDKTVPGDYTGDGKADIAFWRPSNGNWYIMRSENFSFYGFPFGTNGDVPAPGDYDGDGKFDPTVFRPSNSAFYLQRSLSGFTAVSFGASGDQPIAGSFVR